MMVFLILILILVPTTYYAFAQFHLTILLLFSISKIPFDSSLTLLLMLSIDCRGLGYCTHCYFYWSIRIESITVSSIDYYFRLIPPAFWLERVPCPSVAAVFDLLSTTHLIHSNDDQDYCWWCFMLFLWFCFCHWFDRSYYCYWYWYWYFKLRSWQCFLPTNMNREGCTVVSPIDLHYDVLCASNDSIPWSVRFYFWFPSFFYWISYFIHCYYW